MNKVDPFVWHAFDTADWERDSNREPHDIYVVMRVRPDWNPTPYEFQVTGRIGSIVTGRVRSRIW